MFTHGWGETDDLDGPKLGQDCSRATDSGINATIPALLRAWDKVCQKSGCGDED